jgi:hypothetical protein
MDMTSNIPRASVATYGPYDTRHSEENLAKRIFQPGKIYVAMFELTVTNCLRRRSTSA